MRRLPRPIPGLVIRRLSDSDEAIVLDPSANVVHRLDSLTADVLSLCGDAHQIDDVAEALGASVAEIASAEDRLAELGLVSVGVDRRKFLHRGAIVGGVVFVSSIALPAAASATSINPAIAINQNKCELTVSCTGFTPSVGITAELHYPAEDQEGDEFGISSMATTTDSKGAATFIFSDVYKDSASTSTSNASWVDVADNAGVSAQSQPFTIDTQLADNC